eukprot:SAG31_NODE_21118_length_557_cov_1.224891_2_plen_99_part_01
MFDAIFYFTERRITVDVPDKNAVLLLDKLNTTMEMGCNEKFMQKTPHVVLLSRSFYDGHLRPLLTRWMVLWLRQSRIRELSEDQAFDYLFLGARDDSSE